MNEDIQRYDDIIHLPHPEPSTHPRMTMENRAAQFSPFAALTGYDEATREEARLTDEKKELSDDMIEMLDARLAVLEQHLKEHPSITVTYFHQDEKKSGGRYITVSGNLKNLDGVKRILHMTDNTKIPIENIRLIECDLFRIFE
ncbi:hypothetical protein [Schwartzia succinivorans]|jgi:hypothetical protein|uniref:YolD-like protein n=1 Tax=Schwartzia succinivorans DSM 10502 TaxID=1123243 RepID=A0A1M4TGE6_9FIRM|nr:hypothetical protein [Schwartzia succinivorans]SHE43465.1 hypothetical protein SAMN02745190_00471 [Schwartzia succinivorans DSM 10502]